MERSEQAGSALSTRPVVFACDSAYAMPLATTLRSMVESNPDAWPHDINILCDGFSEAARTRVLASLPHGSASIRWIPVELEDYGRFSTATYISRITYARFLIPRIFPEAVSRVLYLDADILVLGDLGPLWAVDLEGGVLGAVLDGLDAQLEARRSGPGALPGVRRYFNAGVLLIDLARWRRERVSERALEYLTMRPDSPFSDQDALNVACDGLWKRLDERWNLQTMQYDGRELIETSIQALGVHGRPAIAHFVTSLKPWIVSSLSANASLYDGFRDRTCYSRSLAERLRDGLLAGWCRLKRSLKQGTSLGALRRRSG